MAETNQRISAYNKLKKILLEVENHPNQPLTLTHVNHLLEQSNTTWNKLESAHETLIAVCQDENAILVQDSAYTPMFECYTKLRIGLIDIREGLIAANPAIATPPQGTDVHVKLPRLDLVTFDGNFIKWPAFKDFFIGTIHHNNRLNPAEKLRYLKQALQDKPAALIEDISTTDGNYQVAWDLLKKRYDNSREILRAIIKKLVVRKPLSTESPDELQLLIDTAVECIRTLKVLKQPVDDWDALLVVIYEDYLDPATSRAWAMHQTGSELATFDQFTSFVETYIKGLQASTSQSKIQPQTTLNSTNQSRGRADRSGIRAHHSSSGADISCGVCKAKHYTSKCSQLLSKTPQERSGLAKQHRLCYNCLGKDHSKGKCPSSWSCRTCGKRHHTLLHNNNLSSSAGKESEAKPQGDTQTGTTVHHAHMKTQVLLSTAVVHVKDANGGLQPCRIFLDSGSQGTFITEDCVTRLGVERMSSNITVTGISSAAIGSTKGKVYLTLFNQFNNLLSMNVTAHILPKVTGHLPNLKCHAGDWFHIQGLQLADPSYHKPGGIDILVGADYFAHLLQTGKRTGPPNTPVAQETLFGWVLSGRITVSDPTIMTVHHLEVENIVQRFWEIEDLPRKRIFTKEEQQFETHFKQHVKRVENGRFMVSLPFNAKKEQLGQSMDTAIRRWYQVEQRLKGKPAIQQQYNAFMEEYLSLQHMTIIPEDEIHTKPHYYLPHHYVTNESSSTTKLRVVFDGSAKTTTGVSLNDTLLIGATNQDDLFDHILTCRVHPILIKTDIAKMFRQFLIYSEDMDYHRIVWRADPSQPIQHYRLCTVTYGTGCASNLATRCLLQLSEECKTKFPTAAIVLERKTYVDDLMFGARTTVEGINSCKELTQAAGTACLDLRKWSSNDSGVLDHIPPEEREINPYSLDPDQSIKALGLQWNPVSDTFLFNPVEVDVTGNITKRSLLADLSKLFDPLGLLGAVTIRAKIILQDLWRCNIGWDEQVPTHVKEHWIEYINGLQEISAVAIPRRITANNATYKLVGFSDASEKAYGAIVYLWTMGEDQSIEVNLVTSKCRVAPLKQLSLPRLELMGALVLAELISHVKDTLKLNCDIICWCDSTITLRWIRAQPKRWQTFVANRVAKIQEYVPTECWRHVPGIENPADLCSRGTTLKVILESPIWFNGPNWLRSETFPVFPMDSSLDNEVLEERKVPIISAHINTDTSMLEGFSSLVRLQRVTAHIRRLFFNGSKANQGNQQLGPLTVIELENALMFWVKRVQHQHFLSEINCLKKKKPIDRSSKLIKLFPYLDNCGILRVTGRLQNAHVPESNKHQIILPSNTNLTNLLTYHAHFSHFHSGFQLTWATLQCRYWILNGRDKVRHLIRSCCICRRQRAKVAEQLMGNLPAARVNPSRPFLHTGVDYAGPFTLRNNIGRAPKTYKGYMCLFVCMATKAIHLEAVSALSTDAFLAALRRFVSRRGLCAHLYSDCGTNFVGAERELKSFVRSKEANNELSNQLSSQGISFHRNSPASPHQGGLWEAGVKSAKYHLRRVIGEAVITFEHFQTILCQVEAVLNSRPLHPMSSDPMDFNCLTPGHFLIGEPLTAVPDADWKEIPSNRLNKFQQQQQRIQHFWQRWSQEYLNTLQQRNKWYLDQENLKVGDLVLIKEESVPGSWNMARITDVVTGGDNRVRVVKLKTAKTELTRPINKSKPLIV